jgi:hypothetical protein
VTVHDENGPIVATGPFVATGTSNATSEGAFLVPVLVPVPGLSAGASA